ncbi:MAG TPA: hypothetical protein PKV67_03715 [Hyphomonas sp.]|nr:hypothetical protein [Hyphomonas sp.]HRI99857.1 hypothetical protein [Hyphomonas sp.]HRK67038.1 hypothetical protein [Hyphomonas sp.]
MALLQRLVVFLLLALCACATAPGIDRPVPLDAAYAEREESKHGPDDRCGPEFLEKALPEFVLSSLEPLLDGPFGPVCQRHDACYRLGEQSQAWCDERMLREMTAICNAGRDEESAGAMLCRKRAGAYHSMVDSTFGAYAYGGAAGGEFSQRRFARSSPKEVDVCVTVSNTTQLMQSYVLELRTGAGRRISREPSQHAQKFRAGETAEMCTGTSDSQYWTRKKLTGPLELRLMARRPDKLTPGSSLTQVQSETFDLPVAD